MADMTQARFVRLRERDGHYEIVLIDESGTEIGHGYKGPTQKRAEQDLKYWTRTKGLERVD